MLKVKYILITISIIIISVFVENRNEYLPSVRVFELDSLSLFDTKRMYNNSLNLLIIYFHPECEICRWEMNELLKYKDELKSIKILFITFASQKETKIFVDSTLMRNFCNANILLDYNGEFADAYNLKSCPWIFFYGKNKKLIKMHKGMMPFKQLKKYLKYSH